MRLAWKITAVAVFFGYFAACAPVRFEKPPEPPCGGKDGVVCEQKCSGSDCIRSYKQEQVVGEALVDILIINDNSGSMSREQQEMGSKFPTFLQSLGSMDYRIAMTTTDISRDKSKSPYDGNLPGPFNGNGSLQDGNLISFGGGKYLERTTPNKESVFNNAIVRNETLHCDQSGYSECPSSDERGIYAMNMVLDRTAGSFMRPLAHLAVIVLSDEDERGISDYKPVSSRSNNDNELIRLYPQESYDRPETFVSKMKSAYPGKTLSVHTIIIQPGDSACLSQQAEPSRNLFGREGFAYNKLATLTGGTKGSICASDYGAQLTNIGNYIANQVTSMSFACRPINDQYDVTFSPKPAKDIDVTADFSKLELKIEDPLPPLTKVTLTYQCLKKAGE